MEESIARVLMEAAFKFSSVLRADMFFLLQTADGKRRFAGHESLIDEFVSGDLIFSNADTHLRFNDDQFVDDEEGGGVSGGAGGGGGGGDDEEPLATMSNVSDISDDTTTGTGGGGPVGGDLKRKASSTTPDSSIVEAPQQKVARKSATKKRSKKSSTDADARGRRSTSSKLDEAGAGGGKSAAAAAAPDARRNSNNAFSRKATASSSAENHDLDSESVILRHLPERMADANVKSKLEYLYNKFGAHVKEVRMIRKNANNRYAIAVCDSRQDAHAVAKLTRDLAFRAKLNFDSPLSAEVIQRINDDDPRATRTLRVSNVHPDVTKADLRDLFEPYGEIFTLELRYSYNEKGGTVGQSFVQFSNVESAVRAREKLIGHKLKNYPMLIGFVKSYKSDCLVLNNFDTTKINKMKARFGTLNDVYAKREKRQALLFFRDLDCASKAMGIIAQKKLAGVNVQMDFASVDLQDSFLGKGGAAANDDPDDPPAEKVNLVRIDDNFGLAVEKVEVAATDDFGGIVVADDVDGASDISDDEMEEVVEDGEEEEEEEEEDLNSNKEFAEVLVHDSPTPSSEGGGGGGGGPKVFRTSSTSFDAATNAAAAASASPTAEVTEKKSRLFIGNLDKETTEAHLRTEFESFGQIATVEMQYQEQDAYAFISFEDEAANEAAMDAMNGKKISGKEMLICMD